jgi:hypothetical protein
VLHFDSLPSNNRSPPLNCCPSPRCLAINGGDANAGVLGNISIIQDWPSSTFFGTMNLKDFPKFFQFYGFLGFDLGDAMTSMMSISNAETSHS